MQYAVIVFLIRETNKVAMAMKEWLPNTAHQINQELLERGIGINEPNLYSVVGFGQEKRINVVKVDKSMLYTIDNVNNALQMLEPGLRNTDGYFGILRTLKDLPFPKSHDYIVSLFLVTDQPRQVSHIGRTIGKQRIHKLLGNRTVVFSNVLDMGYPFQSKGRLRNEALLVDSSGNALVATQNGTFSTYKVSKLSLPDDQQKCKMFNDYGELALMHQGFVGDFAATLYQNRMEISMTNAVAITMANNIAAKRTCDRCRCKGESKEKSKEPVCWMPKDQNWCECKLRQEKGCQKAQGTVYHDHESFNISSILQESCQ
jgi:hypothetical protein